MKMVNMNRNTNTGTMKSNAHVAALKGPFKRAAKHSALPMSSKSGIMHNCVGSGKSKRTINYGSKSQNHVHAKQSVAPQDGTNGCVGDDMDAMLLEDGPFMSMLGEGTPTMLANHNVHNYGAMLIPTQQLSEPIVQTQGSFEAAPTNVDQSSLALQDMSSVHIVQPSDAENEGPREVPMHEHNHGDMIEDDDQSLGHKNGPDEHVADESDVDMDVHDADDVVDEDTEEEDTDRTIGNRSVAQGNVVDGVVVKKQVKVRGGKIAPNKAVRDLGVVIRTTWPGAYKTWAEVPIDPLQDHIWDAFKALWLVPEEAEAIVRKAFNVSARELYKTALHRARKAAMAKCRTRNIADTAGNGPEWISPPDWNSLVRQWTRSDWQDVANKNKKNRMTVKDGCVPRHTGGSISFIEHGERMAMQLGRVPTFREVYVWCHRRKNGADPRQQIVYVDSRAKLVTENYDHLMTSKYGPSWATDVIFDVELWKQAIGGYKKGMMYGVGNMRDIEDAAWRTSADDRLYTRNEVKAMIDEKLDSIMLSVEERVAAGIAAERTKLLKDVAVAVKRTLGVQIADALITNDTAGPSAV